MTQNITNDIINYIVNVIGDNMKELIKKIREYTGLSQTEFSYRIGVSFATINRWENGHSFPTPLAQEKLYELCQDYNVPAYEMIIDRIKKIEKTIELEEGRKLLYHGSKKGLVGEIAPKSRERCDFGKGFYMGTTPEQPLTLICDFEEAKFYLVSIKINDLETIEIPVDIDWAMVVAYNRGKMDKVKGTKFYKKYSEMFVNKDLVIGSIADDRMFYVIDNFFKEIITDVALVNSLSALNLGKQYVAITNKACSLIKVEKEIEISPFEMKILRKVSETNRHKGIDFANEICKSYRREGKYFDEILEEALKGE